MILKQSFFNQKTLAIAQKLLGYFLCRKIGKKIIKLPITEVEAYDGPRDKASHAHRGKTVRNAPMFSEGGIWYTYLVYGNHWMLNIVTGPNNYPSAILIRGAGDIKGPGRLTKFLKIGKKLNGKIANKKTGLWIEKGETTPIPKSHTVSRFARKGKSLFGTRTRPGIGTGFNHRNHKNFIVIKNTGNFVRAIIKKTPRIGVDYAGPVWSKKLYRFVLGD